MHRLINSCGQLLERLKSALGCALEHIGNRQPKPPPHSPLAEGVPVFLTVWIPVKIPRIVGQKGDETPDHTISTSGDEAEPVPCLWQPVAHPHRLRLWRWPLGDHLA